MTARHREREIARRLRDVSAGEPPADLLARLRSDVPEDLAERLDADRDEPVAAAPASPAWARSPRSLRWVPAAAAAAMLLGGGFLVWRVFERVPLVREAPAARETSAVVRARGGADGAPAAADEMDGQTGPRTTGTPSSPVGEPDRAARADEEALARRPPALEDLGRAPSSRELRAVPAPPARDEAAASPERAVARSSKVVDEEIEVIGKAAERSNDTDPGPAATFAEPPPAPRDAEVAAEPLPAPDEADRAGSAAMHPFVETSTARLSTFGLDVRGVSRPDVQLTLEREKPPGQLVGLLADGGPSPFRDDPRFWLLRFVVQSVGSASGARAEEVRARVQMKESAVLRWRPLGDHSRTVESGLGPRDSVTALYEIELAEPAPLGELASVELRWRDAKTGLLHEIDRTVRPTDVAPTWEAASPGFRLAAIDSAFAEAMSAPSVDPERLAMLARRAEALAVESSEAGALARRIRRAEELSAGGPR